MVQSFAYVTNYSSGDVTVFRVGDGDGLIQIDTAPAESGAASLVVHPSGRSAYVLYEEGQHYISTYSIDPATGKLTFRANVDFGDEPRAMRIHPGGSFAYVLVPGAETVVICGLDADGGFSALVPFSLGSLPRGMDMDAAGKTLYVTSDSLASAYSILDAGELNLGNAVATEPFSKAVAVDRLGRALYVASARNIATHAIDPDSGHLGEAHLVEASSPGAIALDPSGRFLVTFTIIAGVGFLSVYTINAETGRLTAGASRLAPDEPESFAFTRSGRTVYMAGGESVFPYLVDQEDGALEEKAPVAAGDRPNGITIADIAH